MKRRDEDHYVLSTGREFYAHRGVIGLGGNGLGFTGPHYGWDGVIEVDGDWDGKETWTPEERMELARYMMCLWAEWGQNLL